MVIPTLPVILCYSSIIDVRFTYKYKHTQVLKELITKFTNTEYLRIDGLLIKAHPVLKMLDTHKHLRCDMSVTQGRCEAMDLGYIDRFISKSAVGAV